MSIALEFAYFERYGAVGVRFLNECPVWRAASSIGNGEDGRIVLKNSGGLPLGATLESAEAGCVDFPASEFFNRIGAKRTYPRPVAQRLGRNRGCPEDRSLVYGANPRRCSRHSVGNRR